MTTSKRKSIIFPLKDKKIRLNEIKRNEYYAKFQVIDGENLFEGDKNGVLIARDYADAYKYSIGDKIYVNSAGKEEVYKIKGIYESGGDCGRLREVGGSHQIYSGLQ